MHKANDVFLPPHDVHARLWLVHFSSANKLGHENSVIIFYAGAWGVFSTSCHNRVQTTDVPIACWCCTNGRRVACTGATARGTNLAQSSKNTWWVPIMQLNCLFHRTLHFWSILLVKLNCNYSFGLSQTWLHLYSHPTSIFRNRWLKLFANSLEMKPFVDATYLFLFAISCRCVVWKRCFGLGSVVDESCIVCTQVVELELMRKKNGVVICVICVHLQ